MTQASVPFGKTLGEKRLEKTVTLRKFAELAGGSPTYLSQVEQCNVVPPTADRLKRIADLLEQNPDEWIALAGHVPEDVSEIIREEPTELCGLLRTVQGMTAEQIRKLPSASKRMEIDVANRCLESRLPPNLNTDTSPPFS
ncbi:MAG: helix-turn-helix domain-containing protein, partial [Pedosphaera sp.]|nr:helix-turn-helix domain-containing protein [Pedosphaera sp.]